MYDFSIIGVNKFSVIVFDIFCNCTPNNIPTPKFIIFLLSKYLIKSFIFCLIALKHDFELKYLINDCLEKIKERLL